MRKKALFAISSLGLGHATRTLPIIKMYLEKGFEIDIISFGNALNFLKNELGKNVTFYEYQDYPALERGDGISFYYYLIYDILKTHLLIQKEQDFVENLHNKNNYNFIFSDGKYGSYSKKTKSFILSHQLSFDIPKGFGFSQSFMDKYNRNVFRNFDTLFIPDYEDKNNNLAGKLSHPKWIRKINHCYVGILSSYHNLEKNKEKNIDFLFTISGYLQEHKESFVNSLVKEAQKLPGKKTFILGDTKQKTFSEDKKNNIEIYSFLAGKQKDEVFESSKNIISRAGYTTIMDLIELEKNAILFPTPNQTEQEYLAKYLEEKNIFLVGKDVSDISKLKKFKNQNKEKFRTKTKDALEKILKIIDE